MMPKRNACGQFLAWTLPRWLARRLAPAQVWSPELQRARELIAAVDKGGLPLNPMIVNRIGRAIGLEVSPRAPIEETIERIRQALKRGMR